MPAKDTSGHVALDGVQCKRCDDLPAKIIVRTEPLCKACFVKYVSTKVVKRMESFRVRNASSNFQRRLLLPLSLGVSSMVLLHILDSHIERQIKRTGQAGFTLVLLHVRSQTHDRPSAEPILTKLEQLYPRHEFKTIMIREDDLNEIPCLSSSLDDKREGDPFITNVVAGNLSASSQVDISEISRTRSIVRFAQNAGCESILWSDTTTRLAEKILSATAKGRGHSLPWLGADGESPFGIDFNYPMRDLYKKELLSYAELTEFLPPHMIMDKESTPATVSSKNMTIDGLMQDYFQSVEEQYPSIVANVLRTSHKLRAQKGDFTQCGLCGYPLPDTGQDNSIETTNLSPTKRHNETLCFGCTRSLYG